MDDLSHERIPVDERSRRVSPSTIAVGRRPSELYRTNDFRQIPTL
jgi:hypothetical protein